MSWKLLDVIGKPAKAGKGWPNKRQLCFFSLLIRFVTNNFVLLLICVATTAARFATTGRSGSGSTACEANVAAQSVVSRGRMTMHLGQPVAAPVDEQLTYMIKPYANPRHSGHIQRSPKQGTEQDDHGCGWWGTCRGHQQGITRVPLATQPWTELAFHRSVCAERWRIALRPFFPSAR